MTDIIVTVGPHVKASVGADGFREEHTERTRRWSDYRKGSPGSRVGAQVKGQLPFLSDRVPPQGLTPAWGQASPLSSEHPCCPDNGTVLCV